MDPRQQIVQTLKNIEGLLNRQRSIETLLEKIALALDEIRQSNQRIEQTMGQAWESYDKLEQQHRKVRKA